MNKPKFTPGPWHTDTKESSYIKIIRIVSVTGTLIANVFPSNFKPNKANAALIAAAPDMYAALEEILGDLDTFPQVAPGVDHPEVFDLKLKLRKLLRKARGESEANHE